jgi:hypothetical protein
VVPSTRCARIVPRSTRPEESVGLCDYCESSLRPGLNCQVLDFTLDLAYSLLKESDIDRGFGAISGHLMDTFGTSITS